MKDEVKITVIATGFREMPTARHRQQETRSSFAAAHEEAMEFPDALDPMPDPMPPQIMQESTAGDCAYVDEPAIPVAQERVPDVISLDTMRGAMANNFEQNDLDVPAFLRKRNDVM